MTNTVKLFISCPSDLSAEKKALREFIDSSNNKKIWLDDAQIEIVDWELLSSDIGKSAQAHIDDNADDAEIYIGIMGTKYGDLSNGKSGTEHEFERVIEKITNPENKKIKAGFLFKIVENLSSDMSEEELSQLDHVKKFKNKVQTFGLTKDFKTEEGFIDEVKLIIAEYFAVEQKDMTLSSLLIPEDALDNKFLKEFLDFPDATLTNGITENISLSDIFIPPKIKRKESNESPLKILDEVLSSTLTEDNGEFHLLILGDEKSGKTALAKMTFLSLLNKGFCPVFLKGEEIKKRNCEPVIRESYSKQYNKEEIIDKEKTVILLDDFQHISLNIRARINLLRDLKENYERVICLCDSIYETNLYTVDNEDDLEWPKYEKYKISPTGYSSRYELIAKWSSLGRKDTISIEELETITERTIGMVDTIMGKNYVPKTPFFILVLLQALQAGDAEKLADNSTVRCYEYLINTHILRQINNRDVSEICYAIFPEIAYQLFKTETRRISEKQLFSVLDKFYENHAINADDRKNFNSYIISSHVFDETIDGFKFKENYAYYYFLSVYLQQNRETPEIKNEIQIICEKLYLRENANIAIFLSYLSKDKSILDKILQIASEILEDVEPFSFDGKHIPAINRLVEQTPQYFLDLKNAREKRKQIHSDIDKQEINGESDEEHYVEGEQEVSSYSELDISAKLSVTFKICQILGQLLKNNHVSMPADEKIKICHKIYDLALQSLQSLFDMISLDAVFSDIDGEKSEREDILKLETILRKILFDFSIDITFSFTKATASFVGDQKFSKMFEDMEKSGMDNVRELIHIVIMLDYYENIDIEHLKKFIAKIKNNRVAISTLRELVAMRLYIRPIDDFKKRHSVTSIVGLDEKQIDTKHLVKKIANKSSH